MNLKIEYLPNGMERTLKIGANRILKFSFAITQKSLTKKEIESELPTGWEFATEEHLVKFSKRYNYWKADLLALGSIGPKPYCGNPCLKKITDPEAKKEIISIGIPVDSLKFSEGSHILLVKEKSFE